MERPDEQLEHVEHQQHAAHNPFDRRVAMTMAIVAACLACMTMLSHRAHNETLSLQTQAGIRQTEADILQTKASVAQTKATSQWGLYQAKKGRQHQYEANADMLEALGKETGTDKPAVEKTRDKWRAQAERYKDEVGEEKKKAEEFVKEGDKLQQQSQEKSKASDELQEESRVAHKRGNRFDLGELGIEMALILCSIAILTKRTAFWYSGVVFGVLGAIIGVTAFFIRH